MNRFAHFDPSVLVRISSTGLWHLPRDTVRSWKLFEKSIRFAAEALQRYFTTEHPDIPVIWEAPAKPSKYGFFDGHATREKATEAILESIDGFVVYTAYFSFLIALCKCSASVWQDVSIGNLFVNAGVDSHPQWTSDLVESGIGDFTTSRRRVGSIVNVDQCRWLNLVPYMIECKVPIWLCWGPQPHPHKNFRLSWIWHFYPQNLPTSSPPLLVPANFPPVIPGSGQLPGETWKAFFKRRALKNAKTEKKENAKDRQTRLNRARANKKHQAPGRRGPRVYYWDNINGFRIRRPMTRNEVEMDFSHGPNSRRIYDAFDNVWDMCSEFEFSPGDEDDRDEDDMDSDDDDPPPPPPPSSLPGLSISSERPPSLLPPLADVPIVVERDPPPTSLPGLSTSSQHPLSSLPLPLESMSIDGSDDPENGRNDQSTSDPEFALFNASKQDGISVNPLAPVVEPPPGPLEAMSIDGSDDPENGRNDQLISDPELALFNASKQDDIPVNPSAPVVEPPPGPLEPMSVDGSDDPENGRNDQLIPDPELDLFNASKQDVISVNPLAPIVEPPPEPQSLEALLYYRYGYSLDEGLEALLCHQEGCSLDEGLDKAFMPSFSLHDRKHFDNWTKICRSVGGQVFESSVASSNLESIEEFLVALEASDTQILHNVPAKFWDLSPWNRHTVSRTPSNISIEVKHFGKTTLCLLHLRGEVTSSWQVAVSPMTALECIRRNLGPCRNDVVNYLLAHGMEFHTLQTVEVIPPPAPVLQPLLRHRPTGYIFDQADFLAYESSRDSFLQSHPYVRRALCEGGIIARLARESMSDTLVFQGPSEEALEGKCSVFAFPDQVMVDDHLPQDVKDLICGTYTVKTGAGGKFV